MNEHIADATEMIACPFCGRHNIGTDYGPYRQWVQCFCHDCGASAASCDSEVLAIAAWNQRYLPVTYSVDNATVTVNDLRTATLFRKQEAELTALRALREAAYGAIAYKVDWAGTPSDVIRTLDDALAKCEKASPDTSDEHI